MHPFEDRKHCLIRCNSSSFLQLQLHTLESLPTTCSWKLLEITERRDSCLFSKFQIIQHLVGLLSGEIQIRQSCANEYRRFASPQRNLDFLLSPQECLGEIVHTIELFMSRPCPGDFCLIRTLSFFFFFSLAFSNGTKHRKRLRAECRERKYSKPGTIIFSRPLLPISFNYICKVLCKQRAMEVAWSARCCICVG